MGARAARQGRGWGLPGQEEGTRQGGRGAMCVGAKARGCVLGEVGAKKWARGGLKGVRARRGKRPVPVPVLPPMPVPS